MPGDPAKRKRAARMLHGPGLGGMVYANAIVQRMKLLCGGYEVGQSGCNYIEDMLDRMAPQDPLEEMLIVQAALAHARVLHLTDLAKHIARESGADKSILNRFLRGAGLTSENLDVLCSHFGLRLTKARKGR